MQCVVLGKLTFTLASSKWLAFAPTKFLRRRVLSFPREVSCSVAVRNFPSSSVTSLSHFLPASVGWNLWPEPPPSGRENPSNKKIGRIQGQLKQSNLPMKSWTLQSPSPMTNILTNLQNWRKEFCQLCWKKGLMPPEMKRKRTGRARRPFCAWLKSWRGWSKQQKHTPTKKQQQQQQQQEGVHWWFHPFLPLHLAPLTLSQFGGGLDFNAYKTKLKE